MTEAKTKAKEAKVSADGGGSKGSKTDGWVRTIRAGDAKLGRVYLAAGPRTVKRLRDSGKSPIRVKVLEYLDNGKGKRVRLLSGFSGALLDVSPDYPLAESPTQQLVVEGSFPNVRENMKRSLDEAGYDFTAARSHYDRRGGDREMTFQKDSKRAVLFEEITRKGGGRISDIATRAAKKLKTEENLYRPVYNLVLEMIKKGYKVSVKKGTVTYKGEGSSAKAASKKTKKTKKTGVAKKVAKKTKKTKKTKKVKVEDEYDEEEEE